MIQRSLRILLFCGLVSAAAASAQQERILMFHERAVGARQVQQMSIVLPLPPTPAANPEPPSSAIYEQVAVEAAKQWMVEHGYITQVSDPGVHVTLTPDGNFLTFDGPGIHVVIVLPCGPFLPVNWANRLMTVTVLQISNGF
jgi:hypothetical protein